VSGNYIFSFLYIADKQLAVGYKTHITTGGHVLITAAITTRKSASTATS
jgi:hypothetical protein